MFPFLSGYPNTLQVWKGFVTISGSMFNTFTHVWTQTPFLIGDVQHMKYLI